jgi:hypothetical protein
MTPFVTLPHGFAMTRQLAASSPIGTISMSIVDFCARQLHFNCHRSISMSASRQCRPMSTPLNHATEACCFTVEKFLINVCDFDLETHATSSSSSVTCTFVAAVDVNSDARRAVADVNVTLFDVVGSSQLHM